MPYDIIPFVVIIASFLIIIFILGRKMSALKVLDIDTMSEEKEKKIKKTILESRLKRNMDQLVKIVTMILRPFFEKFLVVIRHFYRRVLELENKYKEEAQDKKNTGVDPEEKIIILLAEAREKMKSDETITSAEELFIKVIEIDNKNIDAYKGLEELYINSNDYKKAKEVGRYVIKLSVDALKENDSVEFKNNAASSYANIGEIEQKIGNMTLAIKNFKEALKLQPNNPKLLDLLLKISIMVKDKKIANSTLKLLKLADPENQKIQDLENEVNGL
ncbi:MAG: hypothetical protein US74_C0030G0007 [Parcubacteria group bacterium GW2011_GWA2_38_13]|nr:MAG: hypothetical protein US74_C0030G0007 [Parcubacteria group bacterium GW2011_GWA2_38_13]